MGWNPDYLFHVRGSWAARATDEIIVFSLSNAMPAAYVKRTSQDIEEPIRRRTELCPDEWQDSFGDEFYDYALENSFYFLAPKTDWKSDSSGVDVPGTNQIRLKTAEDLRYSLKLLRQKAGNGDNG